MKSLCLHLVAVLEVLTLMNYFDLDERPIIKLCILCARKGIIYSGVMFLNI